jgi:large conductance mechanosensitive channel
MRCYESHAMDQKTGARASEPPGVKDEPRPSLWQSPSGMRYDAADFYPHARRRREGIAMDPLKSVKSLDPAKRAFSLFDEFKAFALKGNVIDLAIGVIIGAAFGKIVDSLVRHIIMPLVSVVLPGERGYLDWKWVINGKEVPYGLFLGEVVNFVIVALALFLFIVKFLGWLMRTKKEEVAAAPPLTKDQELLAEIRDLLKRRESVA